MRWLLAGLMVMLMGAGPGPVTIYVSAPNPAAVLYGPADMLCDLNKCRLFRLPASLGLAPDTIVVFGYPTLDGQDRIDMRRCLQLCRASVLGYPSAPTSPSEYAGPSLFITPVELRLE
jgi:hypothetical protein